ncbi:alpha/beta hydrolase [Actinorhabdospora filicis]|uniref:Alpha/beta hydrolase n=1 Tax=Actinorhabdospora filicis TaxID=1785913 RepID=A0A9W6SN71_9ACTN|nr:alpha/beta fold hydrolase [Actinorhabdospora filicis]GLZ79990.1 alpha/beta hydrolase [Actinorhabdospora filicis]
MKHQWKAALGAALLAVAAVPAPAAAADAGAAPIVWGACPEYSDEVLSYLGLGADQVPVFRALLARTDCGTIRVPLDHERPRGRSITLALTRVRAAKPAERAGVLATNPGGPGSMGYLTPFELALTGNLNALGDRYDVIGLDPRGTGYSTSLDCALPPTSPPGTVTEASARATYAAVAAANTACVAKDPEFFAHVTVSDEARDMDAVRAALGESRLSFYGISAGTGLGARYRTMYPRRVERMWLDSVLPPVLGTADFTADRSRARHADFRRMAAWLAGRDADYGFGTTTARVASSIAALQADLDAHPRVFADLPFAVDGMTAARLSGLTEAAWEFGAGALRDLRAATGPNAPASLSAFYAEEAPAPPGTPVIDNLAAQRAILCNMDASPHDFGSAWSAYRARLASEPVTGRLSDPVLMCAGWPLAARPEPVWWTGGSLVLSGHRYEYKTPYEWALETRDAIGGALVTVEDDEHTSAAYTPSCAALIVAYFATGSPGGRSCG